MNVSMENDDVVTRVATLRALWLQDIEQAKDFKVTLAGGNWTYVHTGVAVDAFIGKVSSGYARMFCELYGLNTSAKFAIQVYGFHGALIMAREWALRMQHYYDIWYFRGLGYNYTDEDHAKFSGQDQFPNLFVLYRGKPLERAIWVRDFRPQLVD